MAGVCKHIDAITDVKHAKERKCEECVKMGARWVHLRTCQDCGVTLCCDSSPNQHATKHARAFSPSRSRVSGARRALALLLPG